LDFKDFKMFKAWYRFDINVEPLGSVTSSGQKYARFMTEYGLSGGEKRVTGEYSKEERFEGEYEEASGSR